MGGLFVSSLLLSRLFVKLDVAIRRVVTAAGSAVLQSSTTPAVAANLTIRRALLRKRRNAIEVEERLRTQLTDFEAALDLDRRWTADDPEFQEAKKKARGWEYRRRIDELERLVLQRIVELSKMNLAETG